MCSELCRPGVAWRSNGFATSVLRPMLRQSAGSRCAVVNDQPLRRSATRVPGDRIGRLVVNSIPSLARWARGLRGLLALGARMSCALPITVDRSTSLRGHIARGRVACNLLKCSGSCLVCTFARLSPLGGMVHVWCRSPHWDLSPIPCSEPCRYVSVTGSLPQVSDS
jgi:hypothetical protein